MAYQTYQAGDTAPIVRGKLNGNVAAAQAHEAESANPHGATLTQAAIVADELTLGGVDVAAALAALLANRTVCTVLHPEWPGVVWRVAGGAYYDPECDVPDADYDALGGRNHYRLAAASGTAEARAQLRVTLPQAFSAWDASAPLTVALRTTDLTGDAFVSLTPYRNATALTAKESLVSLTADAWRVVTWTGTELSAGDWVAGDTLSLAIVMEATESDHASLAEVALRWVETP